MPEPTQPIAPNTPPPRPNQDLPGQQPGSHPGGGGERPDQGLPSRGRPAEPTQLPADPERPQPKK